jgi:23S rRNA pseudouridine1911/1915/1917 synthase
VGGKALKQGEKIKVDIIYEDNHLLVVNKPVNIASQGDQTGDPDMLSLLKEDLKKRHDKPGNVFLGLVHRLDRPVGGCMVFAKTSKAASRLSEQIRQRSFGKTYMAVVHGVPEKEEDILRHYLIKDTSVNIVHTAHKEDREAREAVLEYKLLEKADTFSLVAIKLHTGRPHQIRVQFSTIGYPLYGDHKYGIERNQPDRQLALWSVSIKLVHPTTREEMLSNAHHQLFIPGIFSVNV